ncbi:MAG: nitrous oxide reductase family maturation protein NosD [Trueperaceae bacterium]|nr:nitrous oxide reductase family maturation protein NosD [Trueperaceae bacterium]
MTTRVRRSRARRAAGLPPALLGAVLVALALGQAQARTLEVCASCAYPTVAGALAAADDGDTVVVKAGTYREGPLAITKSITLVGEDWPVLDGELTHAILTVDADDVVVRGLVLRDSGRSHVTDVAALRVEEVERCLIEDNRVEDAFFGIYFAKSIGCTVRGNSVIGHGELEAYTGNAIQGWNATYLTIENNYVSGHRDGIYLEFARGAHVTGNVSEKNLRYGLHFMFSHESRFEDNTFRENGAGVAVMYSKKIDMSGNRFLENWGAAAYGLLLKEIDDSVVTGNLFERNSAAVYIDGSNRTDLTRNDFVRNGYALRVLSNSMGMRVMYNNFIGNTFDVITNANRSYNSFLENYWDAYEGYDLNRDGVGDVPFRPVRLFSMTVQSFPQSMILLRSPLSQVMDYAERLLPIITPKAIEDDRPLMGRLRWSPSTP